MVTIAILGISFALLAALAVAAWYRRAMLAVLLLASAAGWGFGIYAYLDSIDGYPAMREPPPNSLLLYGLAREPEDADPGAIWLWVAPPGATRPRAYEVPYTRRLHQQLEAGLKAMQEGKQVVVGKAEGRKAGSRERSGHLGIRVLPPPVSPPKR